MERSLVLIGLLFWTAQVAEPTRSYWVVWNVGQGEWVTHVTDHECHHFDMGGEKFPRAVGRVCGRRLNRAYFTHWDADHVGMVQRARSQLTHFCLGRAPLGPAPSPKKAKLLEGVDGCARDPMVQIWAPPLLSGHHASANELCLIYREQGMLIPGDAPAAEEKMFSLGAAKLNQIRWLVLSHHGSRTASSPTLLAAIPHVTLAIASARQAKYGHPHAEVRQRLRHFRIPLLTTEDWGNIWIETD